MPPARSRASDPATSDAAASKFDRQLKGQAAAVLAWIRRYRGRTACELAKCIASAEADYVRLRYQISRRAADLARQGFVRRGDVRVCEVTGTEQLTWFVNE